MSDPKITLDQVRHVARLASLSLQEGEVTSLRADLDAILAYVQELDAVDVSHVEPTFHPMSAQTPLRPDQVVPSQPREDLMAAAPQQEAGGFAVPKVLDGD